MARRMDIAGVLVSMLKTIYWDEYKAGKIKIPLQMGLEKHPDLPDVPNAYDMVKSGKVGKPSS